MESPFNDTVIFITVTKNTRNIEIDLSMHDTKTIESIFKRVTAEFSHDDDNTPIRATKAELKGTSIIIYNTSKYEDEQLKHWFMSVELMVRDIVAKVQAKYIKPFITLNGLMHIVKWRVNNGAIEVVVRTSHTDILTKSYKHVKVTGDIATLNYSNLASFTAHVETLRQYFLGE